MKHPGRRVEDFAMARQVRADWRTHVQDWLPKLVLAPSFAVTLLFVYGFILFTVFLSFTGSKMLPLYRYVGFDNYRKLFALENWWTAIGNLAIFASLYIVICTLIGLLLAIFLDQKIRGEGVLRPIYLYPMALSFIVTGTAWKWFLDPGIGLEKIMHVWGWESFSFTWIKDNNMAIYTIVLAAIWQTSGFVMAMFLAGLRGIDNEQVNAAKVDGARTWQIYLKVIVPQLGAVFVSAFVILAHTAIKSYDLVIALTGGGPGRSTELPATFMYSYTFTRNQMGVGAASAVIMLMTIAAIMVPYVYAELKERA
jgi:glucose/mannose transport system permease protein